MAKTPAHRELTLQDIDRAIQTAKKAQSIALGDFIVNTFKRAFGFSIKKKTTVAATPVSTSMSYKQ